MHSMQQRLACILIYLGHVCYLQHPISIQQVFFALQTNGKMGKGKLLLELRMLRLADEQARLRAAVEKEQEDVQGMSERNYRKFVRNCLRQRIEIFKQVCGSSFHHHIIW